MVDEDDTYSHIELTYVILLHLTTFDKLHTVLF